LVWKPRPGHSRTRRPAGEHVHAVLVVELADPVPFQGIGRHSCSRHSPGPGSRPRSLRQRDSGPRPAIAGRRVRTPPPPRRCGWANRQWLGVGTRATAATELGRSGWPLGSASTARHGRVRQGALTRPARGSVDALRLGGPPSRRPGARRGAVRSACDRKNRLHTALSLEARQDPG
jgi:hypothetical protein